MDRRLLPAVCLLSTLAAGVVHAEKRYGPGVTDTEILLGQTMPYSGPASAYGTYGKAQAAFFRMLNEHGGVNGRKIKLLSLDDGYSPPRTVEQIRKLVEQDQVLMIFSSFGTPTNTAIVKYLNVKKIPHLFVTSGAAEFADPKTYPWTMGGGSTTCRKPSSTPGTSCRCGRTRRSRLCTSTTTWARTTCADCAKGWASGRAK